MKMTRTTRLLSVLALLLTATVQGLADDKGQVLSLSQDDYKTLVSDYTSHEWKFNGCRPAIIDFNATWCGPCKQLAPILEELAQEYKGKIDFYSVDVDKCKPIARAYGIHNMPTVVFVPMKGQPQAAIGLMPKEEIKRAIQEVLCVGDSVN